MGILAPDQLIILSKTAAPLLPLRQHSSENAPAHGGTAGWYRPTRGAGPCGLAGLVGLVGGQGREGVPGLGRSPPSAGTVRPFGRNFASFPCAENHLVPFRPFRFFQPLQNSVAANVLCGEKSFGSFAAYLSFPPCTALDESLYTL